MKLEAPHPTPDQPRTWRLEVSIDAEDWAAMVAQFEALGELLEDRAPGPLFFHQPAEHHSAGLQITKATPALEPGQPIEVGPTTEPQGPPDGSDDGGGTD